MIKAVFSFFVVFALVVFILFVFNLLNKTEKIAVAKYIFYGIIVATISTVILGTIVILF